MGSEHLPFRVVVGVDMTDSVTMEADELRDCSCRRRDGMANIQGEPNFRKGVERRAGTHAVGKESEPGKHIFDTEVILRFTAFLKIASRDSIA